MASGGAGVSWIRNDASAKMASPARRAMATSTMSSDLDVDDLADPEVAADLEDDRRDQHELADLVGEQLHDVGAVQEEDREGHGDREAGQDVPRQPPLRRDHAELAADLEPLP